MNATPPSLVRSLGLLALLLGISATGYGETTITRELSEETEMFGPNSSQATVRVPAAGELNADFSVLGDETVVLDWKAPLGKMIEITRPLGFSGTTIIQARFLTQNGTAANGSFQDLSSWRI
ncbi:MAG: hypothetical protein P1U87_04700 [Verrucomicrobiales bacterium]|nr:hypothetical protein [Verrucomicrobiales bacterium]